MFVKIMKAKKWWPIPTGILFAFIGLFTLLISDRPVGALRGYKTLSSILTYIISPDHAENVSYWKYYYWNIDWTIAFLIGIFLGSLVSSMASGEFKLTTVSDMYSESSVPKRWLHSFIGGAIMGIGGCWAGGCILGQLISGVTQLSLSGFIFMMSLWMGAWGYKTLTLRFLVPMRH